MRNDILTTKSQQQFGWLMLFKFVVNYIQWPINEYNKMPKLINHPLNVINYGFNCQWPRFLQVQIYMTFTITI
jgi:hypothetical protein